MFSYLVSLSSNSTMNTFHGCVMKTKSGRHVETTFFTNRTGGFSSLGIELMTLTDFVPKSTSDNFFVFFPRSKYVTLSRRSIETRLRTEIPTVPTQGRIPPGTQIIGLDVWHGIRSSVGRPTACGRFQPPRSTSYMLCVHPVSFRITLKRWF